MADPTPTAAETCTRCGRPLARGEDFGWLVLGPDDGLCWAPGSGTCVPTDVCCVCGQVHR